MNNFMKVLKNRYAVDIAIRFSNNWSQVFKRVFTKC